MKLIHLNYHCHTEYGDPAQVLQRHRLVSGFVDHLNQATDLVSIKHMNYEGGGIINGIRYRFFRRRNKFWQVPLRTHRFVHGQKPDVVLVEGFVFPLQLIFLRRQIGSRPLIIVQHHAEVPARGLRKKVQRLADACVDAYIFTSAGNAQPWLDGKIIRSADKCFEVLSAATAFRARNRQACRRKLGMKGEHNFLWVALLSQRKDPLTVLQAFERYSHLRPDARLYMIYQSDELLLQVQEYISAGRGLQQTVFLLGPREHDELIDWYSAADFYLSGSHREGSGYALVEAICCGCLPIVTRIPSFEKMTDNGKYGLLWTPGDAGSLYECLLRMDEGKVPASREELIAYGKVALSPEAVSGQLLGLCHRLKR